MNQDGRKRKLQLTFLDDDDLGPPVMLHKKVKSVEDKLKGRAQPQGKHSADPGKLQSGGTEEGSGPVGLFGGAFGKGNMRKFGEGAATFGERSAKSDAAIGEESGEADDLPVVIESKELQDEKSVHSIPDVEAKCRHLLQAYEEREMHLLFDSAPENSRFRLFLYAVAHGHGRFWPTNELWTQVLRRFIDTPKVRLFRQTSEEKHEDASDQPVHKTVFPIEVPSRIRNML